MALESKAVYNGAVKLATTIVLGMGTWSWTGASRAMLDDSEFQGKTSRYLPDQYEGGTISFSGNFKKDNTTGQDVIRLALAAGTPITDIRFYVDSTGYFIPNDSTGAGGGVPAAYPISRVFVTSCDIDFSGPKGNLGKIDFTVQVDGIMRLE